MILVVCNFTPLARKNYIVGVPRGGRWNDLLNNDAECYGGAGYRKYGACLSKRHSCLTAVKNIDVISLPSG
jgi:1,4-alpha-glucan branching enzyme